MKLEALDRTLWSITHGPVARQKYIVFHFSKKSPFLTHFVQRFINLLIPNAKKVFCLGNTQPEVLDTQQRVACCSLSYRTCVVDILKIYLGKVFRCDGRPVCSASVISSSLANSPRNASS